MHKTIPWIFLILFIIYLIGLSIDIMDIDAAQYASMSREMLQNSDFLHLYDVGNDYLDKPPFLIWVSALSMKIFGINNFAYRLPSFIFSILSLFATYKLSSLFYNKTTSFFAAVILATSQAFFLMNHDVRTDTILMGWVIFSIWQLAIWFRNNKFIHFFAACVGIAGGMMTKGPIALLVPLFAFGTHFILHRNIKVFFKWQYVAGAFIICVLLIPMCIGLYQQFDMHPEKLVNGKNGVSGIRFFFWTQSFGRITGESEWDNNSNIFYLLQNMLWSFLPWILFFGMAFYFNIKQLIQQKFKLVIGQEAITTGGFLLTYISLGLSNYQLPHYIFVVFPLAAIITARFFYTLIIENRYPKMYTILLNMHFFIFALLWLALIVLLACCFDTIPVIIPVIASLLFVVYIIVFFLIKRSQFRIFFICLFTIISINFFLNSFFYPSLLRYQMGNMAGSWIHEQKIPKNKIFIYRFSDLRSLHFYAKTNIYHKDSVDLIKPGDWIITGVDQLADFKEKAVKYDILFEGKNYPVSKLSLKFLNPMKREKELSPYAIIKIK